MSRCAGQVGASKGTVTGKCTGSSVQAVCLLHAESCTLLGFAIASHSLFIACTVFCPQWLLLHSQRFCYPCLFLLQLPALLVLATTGMRHLACWLLVSVLAAKSISLLCGCVRSNSSMCSVSAALQKCLAATALDTVWFCAGGLCTLHRMQQPACQPLCCSWPRVFGWRFAVVCAVNWRP